MVAVKVFREYHSNGNESTLLRKRKQDTVITREMHLWSTLRHYNVLPFLGYCFYPPDSDAPIFSLVSPWMRNGTLTLFLKANPKADRIKLLIDTVSGLSFLHSRGIVHGDLKPNNILVSDERIAVLADFGLAGSVEGEPSALGAASASISTEVKGTYRWLAPELACSMEGCRATIKSDMWAVGCILLVR
ncbi:kinase-like protein [Sistotremastrum niveocremeum HHB9708]|nr:kinase-like protein [Sistotremastrum niveocremeum HHB9708]